MINAPVAFLESQYPDKTSIAIYLQRDALRLSNI